MAGAREVESDAAERARELAALLEVAAALASTLELRPLLGVLLDQLRLVADYTGSSVVVVEGEDLVALDDRGGLAPNRPNPEMAGARLPLTRAGPLWARLSRREPVIIADAWGDEPLARAYRETNAALRDSPVVRHVRSLLAVPLVARGRVIGYVHISHTEPDRFTARHAHMAMAIASHAAIAIENARLYAEAQALQAAAAERARELTALLEVAAALTSTLALEPLLDLILDQLLRVIDYRTAGIFLARADALETMTARDTRGSSGERWYRGHRRPLAQIEPIWQRLLRGEPLVIGDVRRADDPLADAWRTATSSYRPELLSPPVRAWMAVPLSVRGQVAGYLALTRELPDSFTARDAELAVAFAGHAAAAIENASLYAESRQLAALEERSRLARDLHDSATQSVFSAGMLAHAAVMQHQRGAATVGETLTRVQTVLGDALGELRALLYELQPAALAEEGLAHALQRLAGAVQVRTEATVSYQGAIAGRPAPAAETAIFRIVQEALGNAVKYARASAIRVTLTEDDGRLRAAVEDDGTGFDPAAPVTPSADGRRGGMGLRSMRERAAAAGLVLRVESAPGAGTRITVEAPLDPHGDPPA